MAHVGLSQLRSPSMSPLPSQLAGERVAIELPPSRVEEANEQIRSFVLAFSDAGLPVR